MEFLNPINAYNGIQELLGSGGNVLFVIMITAFVLWSFIFERVAYYFFAHRSLIKRFTSEWTARSDHNSWKAHAVRDEMISQVKFKTDQNVGIIKTLVAIAPLLGLLGTVTGMIEVFDVMALSGSSSARLMAGGVFKATIPTMAGMFVALTGLFFTIYFPKKSIQETGRFADVLEIGA